MITELLRKGRADFTGTYYTVRDCELRPRPRRGGGPPILVGTVSQGRRILALAAAYADLWNTWLAFGASDPAEVPPLRAAVDAACREAGRDPASLGRTVTVLVDVAARDLYGPDVPSRLRGRDRVQPLTGPPEAIADALRTFAAEGIGEVQVCLAPNTPESVERFADVLALLTPGGAP